MTPPPFDRKALQPALVTPVEPYDVLTYGHQREQAPALWALEEGGEEKLPGVQAALVDTFHSLWSSEPSVRPAEEVRPDRRYFQALLGQVQGTGAFQQLHGMTEGDALLSFVGTLEAGTSLLGLVPKKDRQQLQQQAQAQAQADAAEQEAQAAEATAQALEDRQALAAQGAGGGTGAGLSAAQAQVLAGQIAAAKRQATAARQQADAAQGQVRAQAEALLGAAGSPEAAQKLRELTRLGLGALQRAQKKVSEVSETLDAWGIDSQELSRLPLPEALGLVERMRRSASFRRFAELLGRLRAIAAKKARSRAPGAGESVPREEYGRELARLQPAELVALASPATHMQSLQRIAQGTLRLRGQEQRQPLGRGPVIVLQDKSGSMDGEKDQWATGVALALAHYAKLQKRDFAHVIFDGAIVRRKVYPKGVLSATELLAIAEARAGGGTDFEAPLAWAQAQIESGGLRHADVTLLTDGDCAVSADFLAGFLAAKRRLQYNVLSVLCDVGGGHLSDATVKQFSDRVERASAFDVGEAERLVFGAMP